MNFSSSRKIPQKVFRKTQIFFDAFMCYDRLQTSYLLLATFSIIRYRRNKVDFGKSDRLLVIDPTIIQFLQESS